MNAYRVVVGLIFLCFAIIILPIAFVAVFPDLGRNVDDRWYYIPMVVAVFSLPCLAGGADALKGK